MDYFETWPSKKGSLSDNKEIYYDTYGTTYGAINLSSDRKGTHEWKFKLYNQKQIMAIGIDESNCQFKNNTPFRQKKTFNYCYLQGGGI